MKTNPSKKKVVDLRPLPADETELANELNALVTIQAGREIAAALRDKAVAEASRQYDSQIDEADQKLKAGLERVQQWSVANKDKFGEAQSLTIAGHRFGWRKGTWGTKLAKGLTWDLVTSALKAVMASASRSNASDAALARAAMASDFLRTVIEPAKDVMLARQDDPQAKELLADVGVLFAQERAFYLTPGREGQAELTLKMKGGEA